MDIWEAQMNARQEKKAHALVTIVQTRGAAPRGAGSKMLVYRDGSAEGTIGGGVLEKKITADAVACIASGESKLGEYVNAEGDDDPGSGVVTAFIEPERGAPELVVCGAGHVGACVIRLASALGYRVTAVDTRDTDITAENVKAADSFIRAEDFYSGVKSVGAGPQAYYMVSTYGHEQDTEALAAVLEKDAAYAGMLGSPAKIRTVFAKLREKGFSEEQLAAVHTPVGLDIGGETPEEVAFSILAEMQMTRYGGTGRPMKEIR
ncbi:MAG: XdhC/CoxI family protein [Clostridiales bacterium]|nr:XdhC/CoxI family protein [Clostridiales bacterium]